jgi:hypothetical protein
MGGIEKRERFPRSTMVEREREGRKQVVQG